MKKKKNTDKLLITVRWAGRVISVLMVALMLAFVFDEGLPKLIQFSTPVMILFLAFFVIIAGYIVAWKKEGAGALLINSGTIFFWAVNTVATGKLWMGWFLFVFPLTTIPFLYCWWKEK